MRLNPNAETIEEVVRYFEERSIQLYIDGYSIIQIGRVSNIGVVASFFKNEKMYHSFYLYPSKRGKGIYEKVVKEYGWEILTSEDCGLSPFLKSKGIKHKIALGFTQTLEYKIVSDYYGNKCAERSGVPLMNHIDEGLCILKWIGASESSKRAYCLHPIYQSNESLLEYGNRNMRDINIFGIDANVMVNVMEYRSVANSYLSDRKVSFIGDIKLSPLEDVNNMLIADKIQNRKDFEIYHKNHSRFYDLNIYFKNWLSRLGISEKVYNEYVKRLDVKTQII